MKKGRTLLSFATIIISFSLPTAQAFNRPGAFTLTPEVGYLFFADKRHSQNTTVIPAVRLAYNFDHHWGIEAGYGTFGTRHSTSQIPGTIKGDLYTVNGLYRFIPDDMIEPYVTFGLGLTYLNPNGTDPANEGNINAGLGTQLFFDKNIALRTEVRDFYTMSGGKNDVMLSLGVSFLFGGTEEKPVYSYKGEN